MNNNTLDLRDALARRFERLKDDIAGSIASHGLTASGRTARSLFVTTDEWEVTLWGRAFFPALETGSSRWTGVTGVPCTFQEFRGIIWNWAAAKGLNFGQHREQERAVASIASSIIRNGTRQRHKPRIDVYTSLVNRAVQDCGDIAANVVGAQVLNVIGKWAETNI